MHHNHHIECVFETLAQEVFRLFILVKAASKMTVVQSRLHFHLTFCEMYSLEEDFVVILPFLLTLVDSDTV